jgi:DNA relaxase NicK
LTAGAAQRTLFDPASVRIHWLSVTFPVAPANDLTPGQPNVRAVRELVDSLIGKADDRLYGLRGYREGCQWDEKAILVWTVGRGEALLDLTGDTLDSVDPARQLWLIQQLVALGAKATRLDVAFDDGRRIASMDQLHAAADAGNYAGFLKHLPMREKMRSGELTGDMVTFGNKGKDGSGKYMRIYDKNLESGGLIDAIRYECVFAKERADEALQLLSRSVDVDRYAQLIARMVAGAIDFLHRADGETHLDRCARLEWWERIVRLLTGAVKISAVDRRATLLGALQAMKTQYGATLAKMRVVLNSTGVSALAVVEGWMDQAEPKINWEKRRAQNLELPLAQLLAL